MIVAGDDENAAVRRAAVSVAMLQRVARAIDAGPFAVPDTEHTVDGSLSIGLDLLRTENSGRSQVLVDRRQELDVVFLEETFCAPQLLVDHA